jgi:hypothetical protein
MRKARMASTEASDWRRPSQIVVSSIMSIRYNLELFSFRVKSHVESW